MDPVIMNLIAKITPSPSFAVVIFVVTGLFYSWYVSIISRRNKALEALSGVDVQLKKRSDLIPNILRIAKSFMEHESALFSEVVRLREKLSADYDKNNEIEVREHLKLSSALSSRMGGFMAKLENYPELKSSQNMLQAQQTYNEVEAEIDAARRFYNSAVNSFCNSIQIFPGNIVARIIKAHALPFYETEEKDKAPIGAAKTL